MKVTYWFTANKNGLGWKPASWKGWLMIVVYIGTLIYAFTQVDKTSHSVSDTFFGFLPRFLILTGLLIVFTYLKGESIVWGEKEEDQHKIP